MGVVVGVGVFVGWKYSETKSDGAVIWNFSLSVPILLLFWAENCVIWKNPNSGS